MANTRCKGRRTSVAVTWAPRRAKPTARCPMPDPSSRTRLPRHHPPAEGVNERLVVRWVHHARVHRFRELDGAQPAHSLPSSAGNEAQPAGYKSQPAEHEAKAAEHESGWIGIHSRINLRILDKSCRPSECLCRQFSQCWGHCAAVAPTP